MLKEVKLYTRFYRSIVYIGKILIIIFGLWSPLTLNKSPYKLKVFDINILKTK